MKLCIPVAIFPPEIGGPATYVPELARRLVERGHEVHVVTFGTPRYEMRDGYAIHRTPLPPLPKPLAFPLRILRAGLLCAEVVRRYGIEVIYAQEYISGMVGLIAKKLTGRAMYYKYVGDWAWEVAFSRGWTRRYLHEFYEAEHQSLPVQIMVRVQRWIFKSCTGILTPSEYLKSVIGMWCRESMPVTVVPNAVEFNDNVEKGRCRKELEIEGFTMVSVGRLVRWKGFHLVIEALKDLDEGVRYVIIGDGPCRRELEELAERLSLSNVHFPGKLPKSRTLKYICASDLFVLPSYYEGMSHVILEAMSCRTPVLASDIPPNREVVKDGVTGFLTPLSAEKIAEKIEKLRERDDLHEVAERAYSQVRERNSWDNHISVLEGILAGR